MYNKVYRLCVHSVFEIPSLKCCGQQITVHWVMACWFDGLKYLVLSQTNFRQQKDKPSTTKPDHISYDWTYHEAFTSIFAGSFENAKGLYNDYTLKVSL